MPARGCSAPVGPAAQLGAGRRHAVAAAGLRRRGRRATMGSVVLPAGTVTLLFSDIEGSTQLLERLGEAYAVVLEEHRRIVRGAVAAHGGHEMGTEGDGFFVVFARADDAVRAAVAAQRGLTAGGAAGRGGRGRMGRHTRGPRVGGRGCRGGGGPRAGRVC